MFEVRKLRLFMFGVLASAAALVLAACGGDEGGTTEVQMGLPNEFEIAATPNSISAGEIIFNTTNAGEFPHEFVVVQTDLAPDALPTLADGGVDEGQVNVVGSIGTFDPGTMSVTLDLEEGNYVLFCNIVFAPEEGDPVSHYAFGMTTGFTVE